MKQKAVPVKQPGEDVIRDIRRATRRHFSAEEKIQPVLYGLRNDDQSEPGGFLRNPAQMPAKP